jgi:hypothetical protein
MHLEDDYVLKQVKRLAEFLARALGLAGKNQLDEAVEVLRQASAQLLGIEFKVLTMLDARTAVELLGARPRVLAWVQILEHVTRVENEARYGLQALEVLQELDSRDGPHDDSGQLAERIAEILSTESGNRH